MARIRILLADDHAVLRTGLRMLISSQRDLEVVGEASDGDEAVRKATALRPDVALVDISMPGSGGIKAIERIRQAVPATRVLVLTMHDVPAYLRASLAAGASGIRREALRGLRSPRRDPRRAPRAHGARSVALGPGHARQPAPARVGRTRRRRRPC